MSRRENERVAGAGNSIAAEEAGGYAGPRDPNLEPSPRQEGQATIRNNPDFERELTNPKRNPNDNPAPLTAEEAAENPPDITPEGP
jgi:hypothetical protein